MNAEAGLYFKFDQENGIPKNCPGLEHFNMDNWIRPNGGELYFLSKSYFYQNIKSFFELLSKSDPSQCPIQLWQSETGQAHGLQSKLLYNSKPNLNSILI